METKAQLWTMDAMGEELHSWKRRSLKMTCKFDYIAHNFIILLLQQSEPPRVVMGKVSESRWIFDMFYNCDSF